MNTCINKNITKIYHQLISNKNLGTIDIALVTEKDIKTIVITNLPEYVSRYFTKIRLNYNPINKKIHFRTNNADEDIANTFGIINNDKQFNNADNVIIFLIKIIYQKQYKQKYYKQKYYKQKYYKYKQKYLQLLNQI